MDRKKCSQCAETPSTPLDVTATTSPPLRGLPRRQFLQTTAIAAAAASLVPGGLFAAPSRTSSAETFVTELYQSLSDDQRKTICLAFDNPLRTRVHANWHITKPLIGNSFYSDSQRAIIDKIIRNVTSEEGFKVLTEQMEYDDGGMQAYSIALFGNPTDGQFQWTLTGRHLTLRADGNSLEKSVFGGPIVYGHGEEATPEDNLFFYQTVSVNKLFKALDKSQAEKALLTEAPAETKVQLQGKDGKFDGLAVQEMSSDQQNLVREVLTTLLSPYRKEDGEEAMSVIAANGGIESLRFAFYRQGDLANDSTWDIWRVEGPSMVAHFRGAPHVHAYLHVADLS